MREAPGFVPAFDLSSATCIGAPLWMDLDARTVEALEPSDTSMDIRRSSLCLISFNP